MISTNQATAGVLNITVINDIDYLVETDEYKQTMLHHESQVEVWEDNDAQGYALVLQHCPDELETELRKREAWAEIKNARSVVGLLVLIKDLKHIKSNCK